MQQAQAQAMVAVHGWAPTLVHVTDADLGRALLLRAAQMAGFPLRDGQEWYTSGVGGTYVGSPQDQVCRDPAVAMLVDAANVLIQGRALRFADEELSVAADDAPAAVPATVPPTTGWYRKQA